jgi:hypothetical protein
MFRFASRFGSAFVLIFAIDRFLEFSQNIRRDGIRSAFRIHREQPYLTIAQSIEIDHPHVTAFFGSARDRRTLRPSPDSRIRPPASGLAVALAGAPRPRHEKGLGFRSGYW